MCAVAGMIGVDHGGCLGIRVPPYLGVRFVASRLWFAVGVPSIVESKKREVMSCGKESQTAQRSVLFGDRPVVWPKGQGQFRACATTHREIRQDFFEHRDVATIEEFKFFLNKYLAPGYKNYPILYLGFHGWWCAEDDDDAYVEMGDRSRVTLQDLEDWIDGRCKGRLIYFGACRVMAAHKNRLNRFVRNTKAVAVAGYRGEPDWLESAALDMLALGRLQDAAFTKPSINKFNRELKETAPGLYSRLGFRLVLKS